MALLVHVFLDLILAGLFIAFFIPLLIELINVALITDSKEYFDIRSMLELAEQHPFTAGITLTGIIFTTLLPTIVHLFVVIGALFTPRAFWQPKRKELQDYLYACHLDPGERARIEHRRTARLLIFGPVVRIGFSVFVFASVLFAIAMIHNGEVFSLIGEYLLYVARAGVDVWH